MIQIFIHIHRQCKCDRPGFIDVVVYSQTNMNITHTLQIVCAIRHRRLWSYISRNIISSEYWFGFHDIRSNITHSNYIRQYFFIKWSIQQESDLRRKNKLSFFWCSEITSYQIHLSMTMSMINTQIDQVSMWHNFWFFLYCSISVQFQMLVEA